MALNNTYSRVYDIIAGAESAPVVPFPQNEIDKPILSQYPRIGLVQLGNVAFPADDRDQAQRFFITPRRTVMDTAPSSAERPKIEQIMSNPGHSDSNKFDRRVVIRQE